MKKILSCILALMLCFIATTTCFAAYEEYPEYGISYTIPDNWEFLEKDSLGVIYQYKSSAYEAFFIYVLYFDGERIDMSNADKLRSFCDTRFSNENLVEDFDGIPVTITENATSAGYESYGGIEYYKYHKQYTAKADGYYDSGYSVTAYIAQPNDNMYIFVHDRDIDSVDHLADITSLLQTIKFDPAEIKIVINGQMIFPDCAPMIVNDRTMVPIRAVAEKMGFEVSWNAETYTASVKNPADGSVANYKIDSDIATKSTGEEIKMDVAPFINSDRTYLPLRAIAESLGAKVEWIAESRIVNITY